MKKKVYKEKYKRGFLGEEVPDYMVGRNTYMCVDVLDSIFQILKQSIQCFLQRMTRDIAVSKF